MSLNWQHSDHTRADWDSLSEFTREALIFRTMHVGMSRITEGNVEEFFLRNHEFSAVAGGLKLDLGEIRGAIGLSTNAENYTPARWRKRLAEIVRDKAEGALLAAKRASDQ